MHLMTRIARAIVVLVIGAAFLAVSFGQTLAAPAVVMSCPFNGDAGDQITRGFYITGFPGDRLDTVTLQYIPGDLAVGTIQLSVRLNRYDAGVLGTASVTSDFSTGVQMQTYDFGGISVPINSTITFTQTLTSGVGTVFYDTGISPCPGFTETDGTTPPLDTTRRDSVGAIITGALTRLSIGGCVIIPAGSVVGEMPNDTQAYYAPGEVAPGVILNAGTYWVLGTDESGQYYEILLACQYLWVPVNSMFPTGQSPWNGQPLPTPRTPRSR